MSLEETAPPATTRALRSTVDSDGRVTLAVTEEEVPEPGPDEVVVRVGASPINPSDLGMLFAGADMSTASPSGGDELPALTATIPTGTAGLGGRVGVGMPCGNEGGGTVVAAGASEAAQALLGSVVGFLSGNAYAEHRVVNVAGCLPMHPGTTAEQAAACFVNPLTALGMVDTMRAEGHVGLVHTVGASNLGQMLIRICADDGVPLVNLVRRAEHVEMLCGLGAEHVVDSNADSFTDDLTEALRQTKATIAFDAIGGGDLAATIFSCMERVASEGNEFSRYGSDTHKQVYVYGGLDRGPTVLNRTFGMSWGLGGWLLMPFLAKAGPERAAVLRQRVADEVTTTFASTYGLRLGLDDAVDPDQARRYARMATGDKALITP